MKETIQRLKKILRRIILGIGIVIVVLTLFIVAVTLFDMATNPLRRSEEQIRNEFLERIPIGTNVDEVVKVLENYEEWDLLRRTRGNIHVSITPLRAIFCGDRYVSIWQHRDCEVCSGDPVALGERAIRLHLGAYQRILFVPPLRHVRVYMAFDENSELIEIFVEKA